MHPLNIDSITRGESQNRRYDEELNEAYNQMYTHPGGGGEHGETYRRTPSPGDSGVDSSATSPILQSQSSVETTLAKLSAASEKQVQSESSLEKPAVSFLALVSMAILNNPDRKLLLGDIYRYVMDNFPYYNNDQKAWRNSIRHNLSLNECFIKGERSEGGKCNYWSIHPAVEADFAKGDFRRRQARRKSRKNVKTAHTEDVSAQKATGYVTMTSYNPYNAQVYYPQQTLSVYPLHVTTTSGEVQRTTTDSTTTSSSDVTNGGYSSDAYRFYYPHTTCTSSDYGSPVVTPGYSPVTSQSDMYSYSETSGFAQSVDNE